MFDKSRRSFLKKLGVGTAAAITIPDLPIFTGLKTEKKQKEQPKETAGVGEKYVDGLRTGIVMQTPSNTYPDDPKPGWMYWHEESERLAIYDGEQWCWLEMAT